MENKKYAIVRFHKTKKPKVIERGLTLEEAQKYCSCPDTKGKNWFCGFRAEGV